MNLMILASQVMAAENGNPAGNISIGISPADKFSGLYGVTLSSLVSGAISLILVAAALVFFFMLVAGGIKWMMAGGDKEKAGEARSQLTSALIGLLIIFAAWAIMNLMSSLFGVNLTELELQKFTTD